jgi:hypothetical protein
MRKRTLGCIGLLFACLVLAFFSVPLYGRQKIRTQPVDIYDLLVDVSAFPQGWYIESGPSHPPQGKYLRGETESLFLQFIGLEGDAMHIVCRYDNDLQATISFHVDDEFAKREAVVTPWAIPQGWSYESQVADRFKFACAELVILSRFRNCTAVAQYDEYISIFSTHMSSEYMTLEDLQNILKAIDENMALYLAEDGE